MFNDNLVNYFYEFTLQDSTRAVFYIVAVAVYFVRQEIASFSFLNIRIF